MEGLDRFLKEHPFFAGMAPSFVELAAGCAKNVRFDAGQYMFREGEPADWFYLLRHGRAAIEMHVPGRPPLVIQTVEEGQIVGVSWLLPPYRWNFDARAVDLVRAIAIDGKCLRGKCEADHDLGYDLMKRFLPIVTQRLQATRLQLIDVYGDHA
jgi:CRP/FNR family cyclic AMP-dependent transcriptional regulator